MFFSENRALEKRLKDYYFKYVKLKRRINSLETEIEDLDECVDRKIVVDLIQEIVPSIIDKKGSKGVMHKCSSYLSESSKDSDLVKIIEVKE